MSILNILRYPDPRLNRVAQPVGVVDDEVRTLIADMLETMYAAGGIGLAATQVNVHRRILVIDVSENRDSPQVFINPEIVRCSDTYVVGEEGCLSVPGIYDRVERAETVCVAAQDARGVRREVEADGLLAVCLQHEIDHLDGKVFVQYLSPLKRSRIKAKLLKQQREAERRTDRAVGE